MQPARTPSKHSDISERMSKLSEDVVKRVLSRCRLRNTLLSCRLVSRTWAALSDIALDRFRKHAALLFWDAERGIQSGRSPAEVLGHFAALNDTEAYFCIRSRWPGTYHARYPDEAESDPDEDAADRYPTWFNDLCSTPPSKLKQKMDIVNERRLWKVDFLWRDARWERLVGTNFWWCPSLPPNPRDTHCYRLSVF